MGPEIVPARQERCVQRELVLRAKGGDVEAFEILARMAMARLHRVAYGMLHDRDAADDATQRALIDAWDHLPSLADPDRFDAWTYRLVVRAALKEVRRERSQRRRVTLIRVGREEEAAAADPSARAVARDELDRAFRDLSPGHRAVIALHLVADLPVAAVAAALGIPPGTVASRLYHAVRRLRQALDEDAAGVHQEGRGSHASA